MTYPYYFYPVNWCGRRDSNPGCQLSPMRSWGAEVIPGWNPPPKRPRPPDSSNRKAHSLKTSADLSFFRNYVNFPANSGFRYANFVDSKCDKNRPSSVNKRSNINQTLQIPKTINTMLTRKGKQRAAYGPVAQQGRASDF